MTFRRAVHLTPDFFSAGFNPANTTPAPTQVPAPIEKALEDFVARLQQSVPAGSKAADPLVIVTLDEGRTWASPAIHLDDPGWSNFRVSKGPTSSRFQLVAFEALGLHNGQDRSIRLFAFPGLLCTILSPQFFRYISPFRCSLGLDLFANRSDSTELRTWTL